MITHLKLKPGQKGTKALSEQYGDALICVRYRYDEVSRTRIKTVELKRPVSLTLFEVLKGNETTPFLASLGGKRRQWRASKYDATILL